MNTKPPLNWHNKTLITALCVAVAIVTAAVLFFWHHQPNSSSLSTTTSSKPTAVIQLTSTGFVPATLSVKVGTPITWRNTDAAPHRVASNPYPQDSTIPGLHSMNLVSGSSYTYTPPTVGVIHYHDDLNPTHNGTIMVVK
jgi:plastocyanin